MGKEFRLAPFEEQDKLEEGLLRTKSKSYKKLGSVLYSFKGQEAKFASFMQDKLNYGLIRFPDGSYQPINLIKKVSESDCVTRTICKGLDFLVDNYLIGK